MFPQAFDFVRDLGKHFSDGSWHTASCIPE